MLSSKRFGSPLVAEEVEGGGKEGGDVKGGGKLMLDRVFRMELPSRYGRDALCLDVANAATPDAVVRLLNVHLDSLDSHFRRVLEMHVLANLLREPRCSGGIIAGDFNAIYPEDHMLVDEHELLDAWVALHGSTRPDGATWGVGVELEGKLKAGRLDKVIMLGLKPVEIEVLQPGLLAVDRPWSDHCGLRCKFSF
jgi:tyrosyl-DNA phosphodiesterase 2